MSWFLIVLIRGIDCKKQRLHETQRIKHLRIINNYKNQHELKPIETSVSQENSKTCDYSKFTSYVKVKNEANEQLFEYYEEEFIRKLKLRTYINKQRSEGRLIRNINNIYGEKDKDIVMIYGDANVGKQMRHVISTPMIGLKRLIKKNFTTYNFDEFRTSCLDYWTEMKNKNAYVKKEGGKSKRLHLVLVSTIPESSGSGFKISYQNRDRNSVLNIRKLTKHYLEHGDKTILVQKRYKTSRERR